MSQNDQFVLVSYENKVSTASANTCNAVFRTDVLITS
jgi:hypothetical protein